MPQPPNVVAVFPLVDRAVQNYLPIPKHFENLERIDIWILNADDPRDILYDNEDA